MIAKTNRKKRKGKLENDIKIKCPNSKRGAGKIEYRSMKMQFIALINTMNITEQINWKSEECIGLIMILLFS